MLAPRFLVQRIVPIILLLALSMLVSAATPQPVGQIGFWKMIFDDEFNGNSLDL
jgi:hypothetical protein